MDKISGWNPSEWSLKRFIKLVKSIPHDPLHGRKMRWPVWYSLCKFFALLWADKLPICFVWHGLSLHYSVFTRSEHFLWMILYQKRNRLKTHFFSCCGKIYDFFLQQFYRVPFRQRNPQCCRKIIAIQKRWEHMVFKKSNDYLKKPQFTGVSAR